MYDVFLGIPPLMIFGILAGFLSLLAYIPYIIDTVAQRTRPQRASWLIWSVLGTISFCSQVFEGAGASLWFAGVQVGGTIIILLLSIWTGVGRYLNRLDYLVLFGAAIGIVAWIMTENAVYALGISIAISLSGGVTTVVKAFNEPDSETLSTWVISLAASVCAILSIGELDWVLLAYPLYLFTLYSGIILAMSFGRLRQRRATDFASQLAVVPVDMQNAAPVKVRRYYRVHWANAQKRDQNPKPAYLFLNLETRPPASIRRVPPPVQAG